MNRREFFQTLAAASVVAAIPVTSCGRSIKTAQVGKVTAETHRNKARAYLDGIDVTNDCFEADDIAGYVDCHIRNKSGNKFFTGRGDDRHVAYERKYGNVRIELIDQNA